MKALSVVLSVAVFALGLILSGCGTELPFSPDGEESPAGLAKPLAQELNASDNGRTIELEKGQILVISLEANPSTGYMWEVAEGEEHIVQQVGEAEFQQESELLGAPGIETVRFEAMDTGQTTVELVYRRPWEENVDPLKTFSVQVVVR